MITCITATVGRLELIRTLKSVNDQGYKNYQHLIIVDGKEHLNKVTWVLDSFEKDGGDTSKIDIVTLPYSLGGYGGPIYSIGPTIAKGDYICNLDDDNWIEPDHFESLLKTLNTNYHEWSYCLRNIMIDGKKVCEDNCESLGYIHPIWNCQTEYHLDTSTVFLPKEIALKVAQYWTSSKDGNKHNDRIFFSNLRTKYPNFVSTYKYTLNYSANLVGKNSIEYFIRGNEFMEQKYGKQKHWVV